MDSYGQQTYQAFRGRRTRRNHLGEVLAALLLLISIFLLLLTGAQAMQFRSIIKQGKASTAVEYRTEAAVPPENTTMGVGEEPALPAGNKIEN